MGFWDATAPGVMRLPSGRLVRGRALHRPLPVGATPEFGIYLLDKQPEPELWETRWVRWPDFRLPTNRHDAEDALREAWQRSAAQRVEVACGGGHGRTGTALACRQRDSFWPKPSKTSACLPSVTWEPLRATFVPRLGDEPCDLFDVAGRPSVEQISSEPGNVVL